MLTPLVEPLPHDRQNRGSHLLETLEGLGMGNHWTSPAARSSLCSSCSVPALQRLRHSAMPSRPSAPRFKSG